MSNNTSETANSPSSPAAAPTNPSYPFFVQLARIINSGQARSIIVSGNVNDLYFDGDKYVPLVPFLLSKTRVPGLVQVVYELNGPIRISEDDRSNCAKPGPLGKLGSI